MLLINRVRAPFFIIDDSRKSDPNVTSLDETPIPDTPPEVLPLLDHYRLHYDTSEVFAGVDMLFIQHQLGPFVARMKATIEDGLDLAPLRHRLVSPIMRPLRR